MALSVLDGVAIADIVFYSFALAMAILLVVRHGFRRTSAWTYLSLLCLARLVGASLQLATINYPNNPRLYVGVATLETIGLAPIVLSMLGILTRLLASILASPNRPALVVHEGHVRLVQLLVVVGMVLSAIGGAQSSSAIYGNTLVSSVRPLSIVGLAFTTAGFGILLVGILLLGPAYRAAAPGERRLLLATALALPFVLVRLVYATMGIFGDDFRFRYPSPDFGYFIGMSVVMEMVATLILEASGLSVPTLFQGREHTAIDYLSGPRK